MPEPYEPRYGAARLANDAERFYSLLIGNGTSGPLAVALASAYFSQLVADASEEEIDNTILARQAAVARSR
jgi:hypothetical protein